MSFFSIHTTIDSTLRYGRLTVLVVGMVSSSLFGVIKSFSIDYWMFVIVSIRLLIGQLDVNRITPDFSS